ncbi:MAG: acyl carrier protein [Holophaga sp.]|nr:acyl carrier protein [Holophaga sp.]
MDPLHRLQTIFRDQFNDPALTIGPETSPATLPAWDSVAQILIVLAVEEAFGVRFTTRQVAELHSVADLLERLNAACSQPK